MTDADALLFRLRALEGPHAQGPIIVLQGHGETPDETPERMEYAARLGGIPMLATGQHTGEEAKHLIALADDDITVVTHGYHVPRAFLTILKALQEAEREYQVRVWMLGVPGHVNKWASELKKIDLYQRMGFCASYTDGLRYIDWRDQ